MSSKPISGLWYLGALCLALIGFQVGVVVAGGACSAAPSFVLQSISSSEPDDAPGGGDGNTVNDVQRAEAGTNDVAFSVRAERAGEGSGRVYTVTYAIADGPAAGTTATAYVTVPHDAKPESSAASTATTLRRREAR